MTQSCAQTKWCIRNKKPLPQLDGRKISKGHWYTGDGWSFGPMHRARVLRSELAAQRAIERAILPGRLVIQGFTLADFEIVPVEMTLRLLPRQS